MDVPPETPAIAGSRWGALLRHSLVRFIIAGGTGSGVDLGLLVVLHGYLHVVLWVATFLSVFTSFLVNFTINRFWSFGSTSPAGGQFVRYLILASMNWVLTVVLVSGLSQLGLYYLYAKAVTIVLSAGVNYFAYRRWVFKVPAPTA
ncbi:MULTISPECIES: GtrA family protein [unclassified Kitasatospora]|uniref:GtrA family protein n=1 Tax=unclassified Kitasatospora TaxID=2633591 RepID=UPI0024767272|nr:GtrA family protein [Kitasatospora sp. MAP12-44]